MQHPLPLLPRRVQREALAGRAQPAAGLAVLCAPPLFAQGCAALPTRGPSAPAPPRACTLRPAGMQLTARGERGKVAAFRTYLPSHFAYSPNWCTIGSPEWVPRIDPCDWAGAAGGRCGWCIGVGWRPRMPGAGRPLAAQALMSADLPMPWATAEPLHLPSLCVHALPCAVLYLHIICEAEAAVKQSVLRAAGFWFVDDEKGALMATQLVCSAMPAFCSV